MILSDELTMLRHETTVSPRYLSRVTRIRYNDLIDFLYALSEELFIEIRYIVYCTNEDPDLIHTFEFKSMKKVRDFISSQKFLCSYCNAHLDTQDIRAIFVKVDKIEPNQTSLRYKV